MRHRIRYFAAGLLGLALSSGAAVAGCPASPGVVGAMEAYPGRNKIPTGNDLIQSAGKSVPAVGQVVHLHGRVVDAKCNPVTDAVIDLWQANRDGVYQFADAAAMATPYAVFTGAGRTTTDNAGRFEFTTIFPGAYQDSKGARAPHMHILVRHASFPQMATELFFEAEQRNDADPVLSMLGRAKAEALMLRISPMNDNSLSASVDLALPGTEPFKQ